MASTGDNPGKRKQRVTRVDGSLTRTATVVLDIYRSFGSSVANGDVYGEFGDTSQDKKVTLPEEHFRETVYSGRAAYVHWVRSYISCLAREGYLKNLSRGVHLITDKGHQTLNGIPASAKWLHRDVSITPERQTKFRSF